MFIFLWLSLGVATVLANKNKNSFPKYKTDDAVYRRMMMTGYYQINGHKCKIETVRLLTSKCSS